MGCVKENNTLGKWEMKMTVSEWANLNLKVLLFAVVLYSSCNFIFHMHTLTHLLFYMHTHLFWHMETGTKGIFNLSDFQQGFFTFPAINCCLMTVKRQSTHTNHDLDPTLVSVIYVLITETNKNNFHNYHRC